MVKNIVPLILTLSQKNIGVRWATEKTVQKTLEQGVLWEVHAVTHKEIESDPIVPIQEIKSHQGCYTAIIDTSKFSVLSLSAQENVANTSPLEIEHTIKPVAYNTKDTDSIYSMLMQLESVIQDRKATLPEGSYTTHLFSKGQSKIRKKVGEEAVEVVLSESPQETISESADLLYHLFVMLIDLGISPQSIIEELMHRHIK